MSLPLRKYSDKPAAKLYRPSADQTPAICIVDDDEAVTSSLSRLLRSVGYHVECYLSLDKFRTRRPVRPIGCLVLDICMPGESGLDYLRGNAMIESEFAVVVITGYGDVRMAVEALKLGAYDFLCKPFRDQDLLEAVNVAIQSYLFKDKPLIGYAVRSTYTSLTSREREVMSLTVTGMTNKHIARQLGIAESTVKVHRQRVMSKTESRNLVDLIRLHDALAATRHVGTMDV